MLIQLRRLSCHFMFTQLRTQPRISWSLGGPTICQRTSMQPLLFRRMVKVEIGKMSKDKLRKNNAELARHFQENVDAVRLQNRLIKDLLNNAARIQVSNRQQILVASASEAREMPSGVTNSAPLIDMRKVPHASDHPGRFHFLTNMSRIPGNLECCRLWFPLRSFLESARTEKQVCGSFKIFYFQFYSGLSISSKLLVKLQLTSPPCHLLHDKGG